MLRRRRSRGPGWVVSMASAQAHLLPDLLQGRLGNRLEAFGARLEDLVDSVRIGHQLAVALAWLSVARHDPVGEHALVVDAAGAGRPLAVPQHFVVVAEEALELADVADL